MTDTAIQAVKPTAGPHARNFVEVSPIMTAFPGDPQEARQQFREFHAISITGFLDPGFLAGILRACDSAAFGPGEKNAPGFREVELSPQRVGRLLNLALDRAVFLRWLEDITGCGRLTSLGGRLTQTLNRPGDELRWHDDFLEAEGRRLAIVINLGTEPYEGGEFALRFKGGETLFEHKYTEPGSALIFEVNPSLEHRVKPLMAGGPRRVFAGWAFRPGVE